MDGEAEGVRGSDQERLSGLSKEALMSSRKLSKDHQTKTALWAGVGIRSCVWKTLMFRDELCELGNSHSTSVSRKIKGLI